MKTLAGRSHSNSPSAQKLIAFLQPRQAEIIKVIRKLVETESPSHNKEAVNQCGGFVAEMFRDAGAMITKHPSEKYGNHVQADFDGASGSRVMLLGHFDTVWDVGTLKTMPYREEKGRLWGPGILDMKTGIAQMLFA